MNIDFDRICKLAGVSADGNRKVLSEASYEEGMMQYEEEEEKEEKEKEEGMMKHEEERHDEMDDEMVEVDIAELMSEIRRAKSLIAENKKRTQDASARKRRVQESKIRSVIAQEVKNILAEIEDNDSSWVYGDKKPKHSKKGYSNQGRTMPGIGFRKY